MGNEELPGLPALRKRALEAVAVLDEKQAWAELSLKDLPETIVSYVKAELTAGLTVDEVRAKLGMRSGTDVRFRKIMASLRTQHRIDAVGLFSQWFDRNQRLAQKLDQRLDQILEGKVPFNKMTFEAISSLASLQTMTIRMGKELGVFTDPTDHKQGGQGVTIVVQTMVPSPSREAIVIHQKEQEEKALKLVELHRPKEADEEKKKS
jgi:D-ribose pyranose/furanose isomerase RbsD